jgi:diguanylate cyclase (GGDEF)-like protein
MTIGVACPACGEAAPVLVCGSCGSELRTQAPVPVIPAETARDHDQTLSDQDQTWSDQDQTASDRDQRSADEDQHAADEDFAAGGTEASHDRGTRSRERTSQDRELVSTVRDETATGRAETADQRDQAAALRDRGAEGRDELGRLHDLEEDAGSSYEDVLLRAQRDRYRAAADRAKAADDRKQAADDRAGAAREREHARQSREKAVEALAAATTDELTGAWTRKLGLAQVSHELERAHRVGTKLVLAFIDVDGLKQVNDTHGHVAGDGLLRLVGETLRANIRPYDVVVRYGGDELLCAMPSITAADAKSRFEKIAKVVASGDTGHSVTFGFTEVEAADSLEELITRADGALLEARRSDNH